MPIRYPIGGIRTYLKYTYGNFKSDKYDLTALIPNEYSSHKDVEALKYDFKKVKLELVSVKGPIPLFSMALYLLRYLCRGKYDLIHSQGTTCGIIAAMVNQLFRIPHLITFHETFEDKMFESRFGFLKRKLILGFLRKADVLNVVSEDAKANLLGTFPKLMNSLDRVLVIQNAVDIDYFRQEVEDGKSLLGIDGINPDSFVIGYLGRFMPEKGFGFLIDAIEILRKNQNEKTKKIRVLSLGWGAFIREYQSIIRNKGLTEYFVFIEFQPDVRWVLRQINLLVLPSLREASPLVPMEGLVSGTPIVAFNSIGLREVLKDTPARMVSVGNTQALASEIINTLDTYSVFKKQFLDFMPQAAKRFDAKRSASKLEEIILSLQANRT